ncbi:MAG: hypothetical protein LBN04_02025 [Oscillospiraceae bacterium]|jgi:hypothetical protein|nr:hypothetical protein [Oscillospiraceae bacterium]
MKRRLIIFVLGVCLMLALTGCQLAKENLDETTAEDRLVGVFVTTRHLDLFDLDGYMQDNLDSLGGDDAMLNADDAKPYEGKLYAKLVSRTVTNEETGEAIETEEYAFDIEGICFFAPTIPAKDGNDSYVYTNFDESIADSHLKLSDGDAETSLSLEGTIYSALATHAETTFYINPVYQSADGSVYAVSGNGIHGNNMANISYSQSIEGTVSTAKNGEEHTNRCSVTLAFQGMNAPNRIIVRQMSEESDVLSKAEYAPNALPRMLELDAATAYLIVETHGSGAATAEVVRAICERSNEHMETFRLREDGICIKQNTPLIWN